MAFFFKIALATDVVIRYRERLEISATTQNPRRIVIHVENIFPEIFSSHFSFFSKQLRSF